MIHAGEKARTQYGETIIKLLEALRQQNAVPGRIGIGDSTMLMKQRMGMIARFRTPSRWSSLALAPLLALGVACLTNAPAGPAAEPEVELANATAQTSKLDIGLRFTVIDAETGRGLKDAKILDAYSGGRDHLSSDENGLVNITEPKNKRLADLTLWVTREGYVPKIVTWRNGSPHPKTYTMRLDRALTIGGLISDEDGVPIANVNIRGPGIPTDFPPEHISFHTTESAVHSDAEGKWSSPFVPLNYDTVRLVLTHPDFEVNQTKVSIDRRSKSDLKLVLRRGYRVSGIVKSKAGQPIAKAEIREVRDRSRRQKHEAISAADGSFALNGLSGRRTVSLVAQAEGYALEVIELELTKDRNDIEFKLPKGRLLKGRITDLAGIPLSKVLVGTQSDTPWNRVYKWRTRTDETGRFVWNSAPQEALEYWINAKGFKHRSRIQLVADGSEHEIQLSPAEAPIVITGTAVDAESGESIPEFEALVGELRHLNIMGNIPTDWWSRGRIGKNG